MAKRTDVPAADDFLRVSRAARGKLADLGRRASGLADGGGHDTIRAHLAITDELTKWFEAAAELHSNLTAAERALKPLRAIAEEELFDRLRRELEAHGHSVFGEAGLMVVGGIVHVEVDLKGPRVVINGQKCATLSVPGLVATIDSTLTKLDQQSAAPEQFGTQLLRAYEQLLAVTGTSTASQVKTVELIPLIAMHRQDRRFQQDPSAKHFNEYSAVRFRTDLSRLLSSGETVVSGRAFRWSSGSTIDGAVFMYVPPLRRTAHLGRIWFEEAEERSRA